MINDCHESSAEPLFQGMALFFYSGMVYHAKFYVRNLGNLRVKEYFANLPIVYSIEFVPDLGYVFQYAILFYGLQRGLGTNPFKPVRIKVGSYHYPHVYQLLPCYSKFAECLFQVNNFRLNFYRRIPVRQFPPTAVSKVSHKFSCSEKE